MSGFRVSVIKVHTGAPVAASVGAHPHRQHGLAALCTREQYCNCKKCSEEVVATCERPVYILCYGTLLVA